MHSPSCSNERVARHLAGDLRVRDVMVRSPKTLPADASVAELRRLFANPHVTTALLVDGSEFAGAVERDDLPNAGSNELPASTLARRQVPTIEPDAPAAAAIHTLDELGTRRLVVLDCDGRTLRGLLCLTTDRQGFCQAD